MPDVPTDELSDELPDGPVGPLVPDWSPRPMPQPVVQPNLPARYPTFWPLAIDKVKHHGEPVALVVARSRRVGVGITPVTDARDTAAPLACDTAAPLQTRRTCYTSPDA